MRMDECTKSKGDVGQASDLDDTAHEMQASCYEDVNGILTGNLKFADDVHRVLDGGEDVDTILGI